MTISNSERWTAIGKIVRAVGLKGFCAVDGYGATLESLRFPYPVRIGVDTENCRNVLLEEAQIRHNGVICRFSDVQDRDSAEKIRGLLVFIEIDSLPKLRKDEFYHFELEGMEVFTDEDNRLLGKVLVVYNYPAADTLEIEYDGSTVLIPMNTESIVKIDRKARRITVRRFFVEDLLQP